MRVCLVAALDGADFTGALIQGATVGSGQTGISLPQLYSTASYQNHDLTGVYYSYQKYAGANLAGQNLSNASFYEANFTNANFSHAVLTEVAAMAPKFQGRRLHRRRRSAMRIRSMSPVQQSRTLFSPVATLPAYRWVPASI